MLRLVVYWICTTFRCQILQKSNVEAGNTTHLIFSTSACIMRHFLLVVIVAGVEKIGVPKIGVPTVDVRIWIPVYCGQCNSCYCCHMPHFMAFSRLWLFPGSAVLHGLFEQKLPLKLLHDNFLRNKVHFTSIIWVQKKVSGLRKSR